MDDRLYGAVRYLKWPNIVMKVVSVWLPTSNGQWWYGCTASISVKYLASSAAMSAIASNGVGDWYLSLFYITI